MKKIKSISNYILYEIESRRQAIAYISEKNGILLDTQEETAYKYYIAKHDALPPIAILSEGNGVYPLLESNGDHLYIGVDSRIYQLKKKICWFLRLDSQIFNIKISNEMKRIYIICETNVYILNFNGQIIWDKSFDIIVDWKYNNHQTELILYDTNNESYCLSLATGIKDMIAKIDSATKKELHYE